VIIDFRRVFRVDDASAQLLAGLLAGLRARGNRIVLSGLRHNRELERRWTEGYADGHPMGRILISDDLDRALERCEDEILAAHAPGPSLPAHVPIEENDLLRDLPPQAIADVKRRLRLQRYRRGDSLVLEGADARDIYLITAGEVSVLVELPGGESVRVATLSAGMSLGEIGVIAGSKRTADVRADTAVECYVLSREAFDLLATAQPAARLTILENILRQLAGTAAQLTREVAALAE